MWGAVTSLRECSRATTGTRKTAGKVETSTVTRKPLKSQGADKGKAERRAKKKNELKVQRQREREARRGSGAPRLVVLVSLSDEAASAERTKAALVAYCNATDAPGPVSVSSVPNSKLHFTFVAVPSSQPLQVLEACLAADVLVPVVDAANGVSEVGMRLASAIKAQGLPAVLPVITELADVRSKVRTRNSIFFCASPPISKNTGSPCRQEGAAAGSAISVSQHDARVAA